MLWTCTAAAGLAAAGSAIAMARFNAHPDMIKLADTTKKIEDVTKFTFLKEPVVLTAKLNTISYYIEFDNNAEDAVGTVSKKTANYNKDVALSNKVSRSGYELIGWNTQSDGMGTMFEPKGKVKNLTTTKGEIVTLYAIWKPLGASTTASIFSYGTGLIYAGAAILVLAVVAAVIYSVRKKKKEQQKE